MAWAWRRRLRALAAAFPNSGFMGVPLLVALLGGAAAGPMICLAAGGPVHHQLVCIALAEAQGAAQAWRAHGPGALVKAALSNPCPGRSRVGALLVGRGLSCPAPAGHHHPHAGDSATPVALFTIGAVLWRAGQHAHSRTPVGQYLPVALIKLFLHPLLVRVLGALAMQAGRADVESFCCWCWCWPPRCPAPATYRCWPSATGRQRTRRPHHHEQHRHGLRELHAAGVGLGVRP